MSRMWQMPKLKHFTDFNLRKRLAELLMLSRLGYCDSVFSPLPQYLLKRLQKIEFAAASFVYGRYVNDIRDILKLNWLPVEERRDFNLLKLIFKALYFKQWPTYLNLQRVSIRRELRSSDCITTSHLRHLWTSAFFSPLHGPLVLVRGSKILVT